MARAARELAAEGEKNTDWRAVSHGVGCELVAHLEAELAALASQGVLLRQRMADLASAPVGSSAVLLSQPTLTEATGEEGGLSSSYKPFGALLDAPQPRPTADTALGGVSEAALDLEPGAICDEIGHKEAGEEYVPFGASGLAPTEPLVSGSEPWQLVVAEDATAEDGDGRVEERLVLSAGACAQKVEFWGSATTSC